MPDLGVLLSFVGSFVAVFVAFALERRAARATARDDAIERLLARLSEYASETLDFNSRVSYAMVAFKTGGSPTPPGGSPTGYAVSIAFQILLIRTPRGRRKAVESMLDAWGDIRNSENWKQCSAAAGVLAAIVADWRLKVDVDKFDQRLKRIPALLATNEN